MKEITNLSRRTFLKSSALAGGGLVLGVYLGALDRARATDGPASGSFSPNAFVRIGSDESVTVVANHSEMGQGIYTGLAMIVADELDADWSKVRVEAAPVHPAYDHTLFGMQITGGSTSTWTEWERLRKAGASARAMLIAAAAEIWKVAPEGCRTENGRVIHVASGREHTYGGLVEKASSLKPPQDVRLKDPKDWKLIGKPTKRLDTPDKTNGKAIFGLDVTLPGMLTAVIARPPVFGSKLKSFDADKARAVPGVAPYRRDRTRGRGGGGRLLEREEGSSATGNCLGRRARCGT